jgi:cellulose synthase/poly-beta-1,6-N-acetylglucosamine synthase-like glycosyltransferase
MVNDLDLVSIIIPCRNEERFIAKCLDSVIANDYPNDRLEVLVVDGVSEDGTREIIERYAQQYPFIRLLSNDKKITPVALNIGIKHAKGEIIMRIDAHATYEKDYISKCVKYLDEYRAGNIGGTMITLPRDNTFTGKVIVLTLSHRFGVGNSVFRTGSKEPGWVDTVFGGCYKREVFDKVGFFNENLAGNQDLEFNLRLKRAGGKILLHPEIVSYYYTRSDFKSFCKNNFRNAVWVIYSMRFVNHMPFSWRHLVPFAFVSSLIGSAALSVFSQIFLWLFLFIVGSYALTNVYFSIKITAKEKDFRYLFVTPLIFATLHISYGLGSLWGLLKVIRERLTQEVI